MERSARRRRDVMADGDKTGEARVADEKPSASGSASSGNEDGTGSGQKKNGGRRDGNTPDTAEMLDKVLGGFSKMSSGGAEGVSPQITDALTQALLAILGAGPSMAAFDSLLSVQAANGMMYYNAVANQQKTNLLGMAMTAKCVRYMLDPDSDEDMDEWTGEDK
jgi:hypothetical protein